MISSEDERILRLIGHIGGVLAIAIRQKTCLQHSESHTARNVHSEAGAIADAVVAEAKRLSKSATPNTPSKDMTEISAIPTELVRRLLIGCATHFAGGFVPEAHKESYANERIAWILGDDKTAETFRKKFTNIGSFPSKPYVPDPKDVERDAARYRWLRADNAFVPEEDGVRGGDELDRLCDDGMCDT